MEQEKEERGVACSEKTGTLLQGLGHSDGKRGPLLTQSLSTGI